MIPALHKRLSISSAVAAGVLLAGALLLGQNAGASLLPWSPASAFPTGDPTAPPEPTPTPSPSYETICDSEDPCPIPEPTMCPAPEPSSSPSSEPSPEPSLEPLPSASALNVRRVAFHLADEKPCTIKVQQVVVVSEVFKADKKPKKGDTLEIQVDINASTKAKDAAKKAIDVLVGKGKTLAEVVVVCKVTNVDDHDALVVSCQVEMIYARAKGLNVGMNVIDGPTLALAITMYK